MAVIVVIGAGPAGYCASMKLAEKGFEVHLVESADVGGTCLNRGCVPAKIFYDVIQSFEDASALAGMPLATASDIYAIAAGKVKSEIASIRKSMESMITSKRIVLHRGNAVIESGSCVSVGAVRLPAEKIIIATGSVSNAILPPDGRRIVDSSGILSLPLPESVLVVGAGPKGVGLASIYSRLGSRVWIAETMDRLLPGMDIELSEFCSKSLSSSGVEIITGVTGIIDNGTSFVVSARSASFAVDAAVAVLCAGKSARIPESNISLPTEAGFVKVNGSYRVSGNVFCIGDANGIFTTAYEAERQGRDIAEFIASGEFSPRSREAAPVCVFSFPPVSSVGVAKPIGRSVKVPYAYSSRGRLSSPDGFVKVVSSEGVLLGVQCAGKEAEFIAQLASPFIGRPLKELASSWFYHPSIAEVLLEAVRRSYE